MDIAAYFWILLAVLVLAWLIWALLENGPTPAAIIIIALIVWALLDYR